MLAAVLQPPNLSIVKVDTIATTRVAQALRTRAAGSGRRSYARTKPELFSTRLSRMTCYVLVWSSPNRSCVDAIDSQSRMSALCQKQTSVPFANDCALAGDAPIVYALPI